MSQQVAVLIPAYKPTPAVVEVVEQLVALDAGRMIARYIVVNDGSGDAFDELFGRLAAIPLVSVIDHPRNRGKGAALKTGFDHVLSNLPQVAGVVTADADGQHVAKDVLAVSAALVARPTAVVLGVREFDPSTPLRSAFGNNLTRFVYRVFAGKRVSDTQTGLRGWPLKLCRRCLRVPLDGYDFELQALIISGREFEIIEVPISTIYIEGNKSSHFNPIRDSIRIYLAFLRFADRR